jgi:hypothetical protein
MNGVSQLPTSVDEFLALRDSVAVTPEGGALMFVVAMGIYARDRNVGYHCLIVASDPENLIQSTTANAYKGYAFGNSSQQMLTIWSKNKNFEYYFGSYLRGGTPANGYQPQIPYNVQVTKTDGNASSGPLKIWLACSGAASDRPVTLSLNSKGVWKMRNFSSLLSDIRKPETGKPADGDF